MEEKTRRKDLITKATGELHDILKIAPDFSVMYDKKTDILYVLTLFKRENAVFQSAHADKSIDCKTLDDARANLMNEVINQECSIYKEACIACHKTGALLLINCVTWTYEIDSVFV